MSYFEFPHTRSYDGDLGYIIKRLNELTEKYGEFMDYNQIKFANPVEWDINTVYSAWNIVFAHNGYYIAIKPVPTGIMYNNADYWQIITPFEVDTVLDTESLNPVANSTVTRRFNQVSNSISNVVASLQSEGRQREEADTALDIRLAAVEEDTEHLSGALTNERTTRETADTALAHDIESVNTRVDNIAQTITPGGTSGDAELADIRIGANGVTYTNAGDAVRAQVTDLAYDQNNIISSALENPNLFKALYTIPNTRLTTDGVATSASGYFTSGFIPVEYGKTYIKNSPSEDAYHRYCLYTSASESAFISGSAAQSNRITINNALAHYLRFCGETSEISVTDIHTGTTSAVDKIARHQSALPYALIEEVYNAANNFTESTVSITPNAGGFINSDGTITPSQAAYYYSDMISVTPGEKYHYRSTGIGTLAYFWALYKDGVLVDLGTQGTGTSTAIDKDMYIFIPDGVNQMRVSWYYGSDLALLYKQLPIPVSETSKSISILFVGNSLTQDGIAYLPYMLRHYYPEIDFKFYMWYIGGATLSDQYTAFTNNTNADTFSVCENTDNWTNYNSSVNMASVLANYTFDVVCVQEYFNNKASYTDADLTDWNNCRNYIIENYAGSNSLEFISLFHAPKRSAADAVFNLTETGNALILNKTIAQDMIPTGIAIYRALSTDLDDLGDQGHLSPDGVHAQEGLPCLLQTFAAMCWLFDKLAINKSIYGCKFRMTTAIYNTLNVPGANLGTGVITGTDAENLLAQEVAIQAYKEGKSFVNANIFNG